MSINLEIQVEREQINDLTNKEKEKTPLLQDYGEKLESLFDELPFGEGTIKIKNYISNFDDHREKIRIDTNDFFIEFKTDGLFLFIDSYFLRLSEKVYTSKIIKRIGIQGIKINEDFKHHYKNVDDSKEANAWTMVYFGLIMNEIKYSEPERIVVERRTRKYSNSKKRDKKVTVIKIKGKIYDYMTDEGKQLIKERQKHVESWGVRGHFRKYKSGKEVWIQPYVKGEGKSEKQTYKL